MHSIIRSTNLDNWNRKQLLFMQKGGNQKAIEYFTKCGVISETQKHIDYQNSIIQTYLTILANQVDSELEGRIPNKEILEKKVEKEKVKEESTSLDASKSILHFEMVKNEEKVKKKGKKIEIDFDSLEFDDGAFESQSLNATNEKLEATNDHNDHLKPGSLSNQQRIIELKEKLLNDTQQQILNKFPSSKSIPSNAFFGEKKSNSDGFMDKL